MSETTNNHEEIGDAPMPTPEELAAYRKNMQAYYKEQMPLLKAQLEYEKTIADIEEARVKALTMVIRQAQLKAGPSREQAPAPPEHGDTNNDEPRLSRKLKTE